MNWLKRFLLGSPTSEPDIPKEFYDPEWDISKNVDWRSFEKGLERLLRAEIKKFGACHKGESFYGFGLGCKSEESEVLCYFNTEEALRAVASEYSVRSGKPAGEEAKELRWALGDWKYQGFNLESPGWQDKYEGILVAGPALEGALREQFLEAACRVLIRLEHSDAFDVLLKGEGFRVVCVDHDEDIQCGDERLLRVREAAS